MSPEESLSCVVELLNGLPGVTVKRHWCADGEARLHIQLESLSSLATIVQAANASNVGVEVGFIGPPGPRNQPTDVKQLEFRLRLATAGNDPPHSTLQIFGIFVASRMKALGLLPPDRADDLLVRWNAAIT